MAVRRGASQAEAKARRGAEQPELQQRGQEAQDAKAQRHLGRPLGAVPRGPRPIRRSPGGRRRGGPRWPPGGACDAPGAWRHGRLATRGKRGSGGLAGPRLEAVHRLNGAPFGPGSALGSHAARSFRPSDAHPWVRKRPLSLASRRNQGKEAPETGNRCLKTPNQ